MSIINLGNQEISFQYKEPAQSKEFNKYLRKIIHPGFYDGYTFSKINNSTVAISVGTAWFNVDTDKAVSISITTAVNQTVLEATPILCLSFSWSDTTTNYIDWTWRAIGEATATNEIIVGKVNFSGGIVDGTFDYTNRTVGLIDTTGNIYVSQYIKFGATNNYNLTAESNGLLITKGDSTANLFHFTNSSTGTTVTDGFEVGIDADEQGRIWNYENTDLVIGTNNTTLLVLKNSGIINIPAATETRLIRIGQGRSGDGISYLDLVGDATYTDYGLRILRNGGQNGVSQIIHHGTGDLRIQTNEAADIVFYTTNAIVGRFKANGYFGVGVNPSNPLHVQSTTTPQVRIGYDAGSYWTFGVADGGDLTLTAGEATGRITFNTGDSDNYVAVYGGAALRLISADDQSYGDIYHNNSNIIITTGGASGGNIVIANTTECTGAGTGALQVSGGAHIAGRILTGKGRWPTGSYEADSASAENIFEALKNIIPANNDEILLTGSIGIIAGNNHYHCSVNRAKRSTETIIIIYSTYISVNFTANVSGIGLTEIVINDGDTVATYTAVSISW
jgi:hypothetical protein